MTAKTTEAPPGPARADPEMALIVRLGGEALALPVTEVHEVIAPVPATQVPFASPFAPSLVNVRGSVVPLIDLRHRLRMPAGATQPGRIVVLDLTREGTTTRLALGADAVEEVIEIDPSRIDPLPEGGAPWPEPCVRGTLRRGDDMLLVLATEPLFRPEGGAQPAN